MAESKFTKERVERVEAPAEKILLAWCHAGFRQDPNSSERFDLIAPDGQKVHISQAFDTAQAFVDEADEEREGLEK